MSTSHLKLLHSGVLSYHGSKEASYEAQWMWLSFSEHTHQTGMKWFTIHLPLLWYVVKYKPTYINTMRLKQMAAF